MTRRKVSCFGNTESELEGIKKDFLQELDSATTPEQFHELLIESSKIDEAFSKAISGKCGSYENFVKRANANKMEDVAWEKVVNTLSNWDDWKTLAESFCFYVSEAVFGVLRNWETDILDHMQTIAETAEQKERVQKDKKFQTEITRNLKDRIFRPTEEQLYDEFVRQSTL